MTVRRPGARREKVVDHGRVRDPDPEVVDRLVDAVLAGGPDRARQLAERASSEAEAEVVRLVNAIREIGAGQPPMDESRVDGIVAALREEASAESSSSWPQRWIGFLSRDFLLSRDILFVGLGTGLGLGFGLVGLDSVAASAPGNRIAAALVGICGALVSILLHRRAVERERLASPARP